MAKNGRISGPVPSRRLQRLPARPSGFGQAAFAPGSHRGGGLRFDGPAFSAKGGYSFLSNASRPGAVAAARPFMPLPVRERSGRGVMGRPGLITRP
ncbi:MAG: hypothetical protein LBP22_02380 [Deltaproteobacteria bacterium]|nr:hypothetical protein [Deltaproteobacteria bacterium]